MHLNDVELNLESMLQSSISHFSMLLILKKHWFGISSGQMNKTNHLSFYFSRLCMQF